MLRNQSSIAHFCNIIRTTRHTIQTLITQFLHPDHAHAYRIAAFDVLLRFVYQFAAHDVVTSLLCISNVWQVEQLLLDAIPKVTRANFCI